MKKSVVSIAKGFDADLVVHQAIESLGGIRRFVRPGTVVVIKPNAGHEAGPETAVNTSPQVVKAVIAEVKQAGPKKIILAESSGIGFDTMACLEISGIKKAAEEAGIDEIRDIKKESDLDTKEIENPSSSIKFVQLPRFLLEADHMINVPIFKSHVSMVFTCALKNLTGVVQDVHHFAMHTTNLARSMMDLGSIFRPDLTVADMIRPMEGFGPFSGLPFDFGAVLASTDMVALDATACRLVGLDMNKVEYFNAARDTGLGHFDEAFIKIRGCTINETKKQLYLPYLQGFGAWPEYHFHVHMACSTCQGLMAFTMERLKALEAYETNKGLNIVLGRHSNVPDGVRCGEKLILNGDCTLALKKKIEDAGGSCLYVPGCPPLEPFPVWTIIDKREQPTERSTRDRHVAEDRIFKIWLHSQKGERR